MADKTIAYVTSPSSEIISVIDIDTNSEITTIPVAGLPFFVAVAPNGQFAYVSNLGSFAVSVIDTATNTVVDSIPVGGTSLGIDVTPDNRYVYVGINSNDFVAVIDTDTNQVVTNIPVTGGGTRGLAISPDGSFVYALCTSNGSRISVIDTGSTTEVATIPVGVALYLVVFRPDGQFAYVSDEGTDTVYVIDTNTNSVETTVTVGSGSRGIAVTPNGNFVYAAVTGPRTVSVIDTTTNTVAETIALGFSNVPNGLAITPDGNFAYVTNVSSNNVFVIDTNCNDVVDTVTDGQFPIGISIADIPGAGVDLSITKVGFPDPLKLGENLAYSITVTNNGLSNATGVTLIDPLPLGVDLVSVEPTQGTCSVENRVVTCNLMTLEPGRSAGVTIIVTPFLTGTICNRVVVSANETDPNPFNNTAVKCTTILETTCAEVIKVYVCCTQGEVKDTSIWLPFYLRGGTSNCKVYKTKCEVAQSTPQPGDLVQAELKIKLYVQAEVRKGFFTRILRRTICLNKNVTLFAPEGTEIICNIVNPTCGCANNNNKLECTVNFTVVAKSTGTELLEIPHLGQCDCRPC